MTSPDAAELTSRSSPFGGVVRSPRIPVPAGRTRSWLVSSARPCPHLGSVVSGRIHTKADDGAEADLGPGDAYRLEPGHHAWVVGDEPVVGLESESKTAETTPRPDAAPSPSGRDAGL